MFEKKDKLSYLIKNFKSESKNYSRLIINKLEEIKNKDNYPLKSEMSNILSNLRSIIYNSSKEGHPLDKYSWSGFFGSTVNNLYNTTLSQFRRSFNHPVTDILSSIMSRVNMTKLMGFAYGGEIPTNTPVLVGEHGPELFMSKSSGNIVPNNQLLFDKKRFDNPINLSFHINTSQVSEISNEIEKEIPRITNLIQNSLLNKLQLLNL